MSKRQLQDRSIAAPAETTDQSKRNARPSRVALAVSTAVLIASNSLLILGALYVWPQAVEWLNARPNWAICLCVIGLGAVSVRVEIMLVMIAMAVYRMILGTET